MASGRTMGYCGLCGKLRQIVGTTTLCMACDLQLQVDRLTGRTAGSNIAEGDLVSEGPEGDVGLAGTETKVMKCKNCGYAVIDGKCQFCGCEYMLAEKTEDGSSDGSSDDKPEEELWDTTETKCAMCDKVATHGRGYVFQGVSQSGQIFTFCNVNCCDAWEKKILEGRGDKAKPMKNHPFNGGDRRAAVLETRRRKAERAKQRE